MSDKHVSDAPEARRSEQMKHCSHWIGGRPWDGAAERRGDIYNPATGQVTGTVDFASATVVGDAVAAAAKALPGWRSVSLAKRTTVLFAFRELINAHRGELAGLVSAEHGKVISDADGEVARGLEVVEFACGLGHLLKGGYSENVSTGVDAYSIRQPLGVVAGITPFNFPAMVPMWMFPIAIACGNTFVLKPSEKDPSASLLLARLLAEAGLPDGVFNVVHGDKEAVDAILTHPDVRAVSFVGSTPIARYVYETGTADGQAGAGAGRGQEPHGGAPRRGHRPGRRRGGVGRVRLGGRALHGGLGAGGGGLGRRRTGRQDRRPGERAAGRPRHRRALGDGPARHRPAPRQGRLLPGHRRQGGRHAGGGRPDAPDYRGRRRAASGSGRACSTTSRRR